MKAKSALVCLASLLCICGVALSQKAQDERQKLQTARLLSDVRRFAQEGASGNATPTPTPPRSTMHVTQRIQQDDPGYLRLVLDFLRGH